jgi:hypothetical protein
MANNYDYTVGKTVMVLGKSICAECQWTGGTGLKFQAKLAHFVPNILLGELPHETIQIWDGGKFLFQMWDKNKIL